VGAIDTYLTKGHPASFLLLFRLGRGGLQIDLDQVVAGARIEIEPVEFFQLRDLRQRRRSERSLPIEDMQHDAFQQSPSVMSWYSAKPLSTFKMRFSMRMPVCTRSTTKLDLFIMVSVYHST